MKTKTKTFDCVELQHRGGAIIRQKLRGMTREQELEYWRRQSKEFMKEWREARAKSATDEHG